jgi:hypothetical protein
MALALSVLPGDLTGTFVVSGSAAAGSILGARLTGECRLDWTTVGAFAGDGSQAISVARGPWVFVAQSGSSLSPPEHVYVPEAADNVHAAVFDAVVARIESLALPRVGNRVFKRGRPENVAGSWPCVIVTVPGGVGETVATGTDGNNERSGWAIGDRVVSKDTDAMIDPTLELRRIVFAAFDRPAARIQAGPSVFETRVEPGAVVQDMVTDGGTGYRIVGSVLTVRAGALVRRGV